jgi:hypothetical protein
LTPFDSNKNETIYRLGFKVAALEEWNALDGSVKNLFCSVLKTTACHFPHHALTSCSVYK